MKKGNGLDGKGKSFIEWKEEFEVKMKDFGKSEKITRF